MVAPSVYWLISPAVTVTDGKVNGRVRCVWKESVNDDVSYDVSGGQAKRGKGLLELGEDQGGAVQSEMIVEVLVIALCGIMCPLLWHQRERHAPSSPCQCGHLMICREEWGPPVFPMRRGAGSIPPPCPVAQW